MGSEVKRGYYSVLRWRTDATRDEARNVAVVLVEPRGRFGGIRYAPVSSISPVLHEQGLLDGLLVNLERRYQATQKPDLEWLNETQRTLQNSLYLTEPRSIAVPDVDAVLDGLYTAYVAPRQRPGATTKGVVIDRVVGLLRRRGLNVVRGQYVQDFFFDIVVQAKQRPLSVVQVLSFASRQRNWIPVEHDAGHFLYALRQTQGKGLGIIQPPAESQKEGATASFARVLGWFKRARVHTLEPGDLVDPRQVLFQE